MTDIMITILAFVIGIWGMFITLGLSNISHALDDINETLKKLKGGE